RTGGHVGWVDVDPEEIADRVEELAEVTYRSASLGIHEDLLTCMASFLISEHTQGGAHTAPLIAIKSLLFSWSNAAPTATPKALKEAGFERGIDRITDDLIGKLIEGLELLEEQGGLQALKQAAPPTVEKALSSMPGISEDAARCITHHLLQPEKQCGDPHESR